MTYPYSCLKYFLLAAGLLIHAFSFCQQAAILGKITDENNESLTGAITELRSAGDSSLVKVNVADSKGQFTFVNVKAGRYFLKASLLGFAAYNGKVFSYDGAATKELPVIKMFTSAVTLQQANVTAIK